jgi:hypothetical protein
MNLGALFRLLIGAASSSLSNPLPSRIPNAFDSIKGRNFPIQGGVILVHFIGFRAVSVGFILKASIQARVSSLGGLNWHTADNVGDIILLELDEVASAIDSNYRQAQCMKLLPNFARLFILCKEAATCRSQGSRLHSHRFALRKGLILLRRTSRSYLGVHFILIFQFSSRHVFVLSCRSFFNIEKKEDSRSSINAKQHTTSR